MASARATFLAILDRTVVDASIQVTDASGCVQLGARGHSSNGSPDVAVRVVDPGFYASVLTEGNLGLGEAFVAGHLEITAGSLEEFLSILLRNKVSEKVRGNLLLAVQAGAVRLTSVVRGKQANIARHYDLGIDLFECFLDRTLTYSCGYAHTPEDGLDRLQVNKLDRICRKLRLQNGEKLLDIGCGFGGLLIHAATHYGVHGLGITNSRDHVLVSRERIRAAGLDSMIQVERGDYSNVRGRFDKVVSVGMMEHVPRSEYRDYVRTVHRVLPETGLGLIHTIGCTTGHNRHDPFIQKYIFPGSNQPRLSEIVRALERERLPVVDIENLARHYYLTVGRWLERFRENRDRLDSRRYPDSFKRLWEYYLCCGVAASRWSESALFQVLFIGDHRTDIPLVRI